MFGKYKKPVGPAQAAVFHAIDRRTKNASKNSESITSAPRSLKLGRILSPFKEEQNPPTAPPPQKKGNRKQKEERMGSCICSSRSGSAFNLRTLQLQEGKSFVSSPIRIAVIVPANRIPALRVRASTVDSSSDFARRIERAWLISQQPRPIVCSSCNSKGHIECKWCGGTGFFILGDNMLCEVPSRNTSCIICAGKGSTCCSDCHGTGYRAKWLEEPPSSQ